MGRRAVVARFWAQLRRFSAVLIFNRHHARGFAIPPWLRKEASMKIYAFDGSPTSRIVLLFCSEERIQFDKVDINLLEGAHLAPSYQAINPCSLVPVLEDGDFRLSESSAILKYLAEKVESRAYPRE